MRSKRTIFHLLFFLLASTPLLAQEEQDEIPADLPEGTVFNDSLEVVEDSTQLQVGIVDTKIHLLSRTYGDSIVLRWAPEDYATWRYVNRVGMDVLRYSEEHPFEADTLASRLRPLTLEQFRQRLDRGHKDRQAPDSVFRIPHLLQFPAPVVILMYLVDQQVRTSGLDKPGRRIDERVFNKITDVRGTIQDMTVAVLEILADILLHES